MARGNALLVVERILRDRDGIWHQIGAERDLGRLIGQMLMSSALGFALYGAVLGASHSVAQAAVSAVKLPLLFGMTLAICLPTLYLFNLVFGARLQVRQALALVLVTITVTAALSLAFAPISLFFLITANQYSFYKLLNVGILALAALVGLRFLTAGMSSLNDQMADAFAAKRAARERAAFEDVPAAVPAQQAAQVLEVPVHAGVAAAPTHGGMLPNGQQPVPQPGVPVERLEAAPFTDPRPRTAPRTSPSGLGERPASMTLLYVWTLLFGFVGTQLAWTLRPFLGSPGRPFQIFREIEGNFYVNIVETLGRLF